MDHNNEEVKPKKRGRKVGSKNKNKIASENFLEKPPPKKRGRKPKENIIKNDNPVFTSNTNTNNLIIRLKKVNVKHDNIDSFDNKEIFEEINETNEDNVCSLCWNCCHSFENNTFGIPIKYTNNIFYIYGYFCSLECASRYTFDNFNNNLEIYSLINLYYNISNNTIGKKINLAPEKLLLKNFGGSLDIGDYRKNFKTNTIFNISIPPIIPINHVINTYENNLNQANNKKDLKLYRKNNLPNQENSIKNSMNLLTS